MSDEWTPAQEIVITIIKEAGAEEERQRIIDDLEDEGVMFHIERLKEIIRGEN